MKHVVTHRKTNRQAVGKRADRYTRDYAKIGEQSVSTWAEKKSVAARTEEHATMCTALSRCVAVRPCVDTCIKVRASDSERADVPA